MPPQAPQTPTPVFTAPTGQSKKAVVLAVILGVLLIGSLAFGLWAFGKAQTYKSNSAKAAAAAAAAAKQAQSEIDQANFAQQLKAPYKSFIGPATYGSLKFSYPKDWSVYLDQSSSSDPVNGYFHPSIVPSIGGDTAYALRLEIKASSYDSVIGEYQSQVESGELKASVYVPAKLAKSANVQRGTRFDGALTDNFKGALVAVPLRDQTILVYTQSTKYVPDFNNIVLPSLTFSP